MTKATEFMSQGKEAIQKGQFQQAEKYFQEAISADPEFADAKVELSRIVAARGNLKQAETLADQALQRNPGHAMGLALKGVYSNARDQYHEGAEWLEKAIQADPKLDMAYVNLGISQRVLGKLDDSEKNLRKAIQLNPRNHEAYYCLGFTLCLQKKIEEGIFATLESLKINPYFIQGYLALGELYTKAGKSDLVIQLYQEALRHVPHAVPIRERLHGLYLAKKDFKGAEQELEKIDDKLKSINEWMELGKVCLINGRFERAEQAFQKATELAPKAWEPHYNLGEIYTVAKLSDKARTEYEQAIRLNQNSFKPH